MIRVGDQFASKFIREPYTVIGIHGSGTRLHVTLPSGGESHFDFSTFQSLVDDPDWVYTPVTCTEVTLDEDLFIL